MRDEIFEGFQELAVVPAEFVLGRDESADDKLNDQTTRSPNGAISFPSRFKDILQE